MKEKSEKRGRSRRRLRLILCIVVVIIVVLLVAMLIYLERYYHADASAFDDLQSYESVTVTETKDAYYFDGPGEDEAVVFYPGGKVEEESYAPLMHQIAAQGKDVFLLKLPFRLAVFDMDAAEDVMEQNSYYHWILAGHSLGGVAASSYTAEHAEKIDGLVLLASYPTKEIPDEVQVLSIYGSEDQVLNQESYQESKELWPVNAREIVIAGGNHAQYGNYGEQKGDGTAVISADEQQTETTDAILEVFP